MSHEEATRRHGEEVISQAINSEGIITALLTISNSEVYSIEMRLQSAILAGKVIERSWGISSWKKFLKFKEEGYIDRAFI